MESSSSPWLSLALTVLERFMTMRTLTSNCKAADLGTDCSHPIIFGAPLMWKLTCKYAYKAFPEDGVVSHPHTSWPYTSLPHTTVMFILKTQHPLFMSFVLLNFSFFPSSSNKFILILGSRFQGFFLYKRGGIDWLFILDTALFHWNWDQTDMTLEVNLDSDSWFWIRFIKSDSGGN